MTAVSFTRRKRHSRPAHRQADRCRRSVLHRHQCRTGRQGLPRHHRRRPRHLGAHRLADVDDLRACLLRRRDDADVDAALRRRAVRLCAARLAASVGRDDRCRHPDQQDGAGAPQGLRPDAGAALRHLDGKLRQWRRLLPLLVFGGARLRPHRAGRHLRAGLPADGRGAALWRDAAAEEDPPGRNDRALTMSEKLQAIGDAISAGLPGAVTGYEIAFGELNVYANAADIVKIVRFLRDDPNCQFWNFIDVTAVDYPQREQRFDVVYHFLSPKLNTRVRVKVDDRRDHTGAFDHR